VSNGHNGLHAEVKLEESGLQRLELLASVNAESFYTFLGYQAEGRTELVLGTGVAMAAVKMARTLR
jgi:hypothetical protein